MSDIGDKIYQRRKALNITQRELAERIDVSDKTVSRWETGATIPDADQIPFIAYALQCEPNDLFDRETAEKLAKQAEKQTVSNGKKYFIISFVVAAILASFSAVTFLFTQTFDQQSIGFLLVGIFLAIASLCVYAAAEIIFSRSYSGKYHKQSQERVDFSFSVAYFASIAFLSSTVLAVSMFHDLANALIRCVISLVIYPVLIIAVLLFFRIKHQRFTLKTRFIVMFFVSLGIFAVCVALLCFQRPTFIEASGIGEAFNIILIAFLAIDSIRV